MKVMVLGATGFVGQRIVNELKEAGNEVVSVGGPESRKTASSNKHASLYCDITIPDDLAKLGSVGQVDAVVHAAGLAHQFKGGHAGDFERINVQGAKAVAETAFRLNAKHFVMISSVLVYGDRPSPGGISEESQCCPKDAYAQSKLDGEAGTLDICRKNGIDVTIFRPAPIIGDGSKGNFARLIRTIDQRRFFWIGRGENKKSLIYVGDVARAVATVIKLKSPGFETFNLAAPPLAMSEIVSEIGRSLGKPIPKFSISPGFALRILKPVSKIPLLSGAEAASSVIHKWISDEIYSAAKVEKAYGFTAKTDILESIRRDVNYYLENVGKKRKL